MNWEDLKVEHRDGIATITINRPDKGNMFRRQTTLELDEELRQLRNHPALRLALRT